MSAPGPQAGEARPCKACGMPIEFRLGPNGRLIPLQKVRTVYELSDEIAGGHISEKEKLPLVDAFYVSHFETCPSASSFSKKGRRD